MRVLRLLIVTAILRKVVRENVQATIPKGNLGYDQHTVPDTVAVKPTLVVFLQHSQTYHVPWPFVPFFQISLKNSELKTTHNTFRNCRMHFFRQLFST